jgi:hypothetical protein
MLALNLWGTDIRDFSGPAGLFKPSPISHTDLMFYRRKNGFLTCSEPYLKPDSWLMFWLAKP